MSNGTALTYTGAANGSLGANITVASGGTGTLRNTGAATLTLTGTLNKNSSILTFAQGSFNVSGSITGSSANSDLVVDSATVTLNGANDYNGPTYIINSGTLNANAAGALPTSTLSAVTINGSSTLALGANQSVASLAGTSGSSVNLNAHTLTINGSTSTTYSGGISGTGNLVKNGSGTQVLAGATTFTGSTTINSGTLQAASVGALGSTGNITVNNGGSFLVSANNAISTSTGITLNSTSTTVAGLTFSGNSTNTVGALTLSADSIIDLGAGSVVMTFTDIVGLANYSLKIYNWQGTTLWGGGDRNNTDQIYVTDSLAANELARISFYSGGLNSNSFLGNGYQLSGSGFYNHQIIPVPEPETYATAAILLVGYAIYQIRLKRKFAQQRRFCSTV